jgi:hypothetical protein
MCCKLCAARRDDLKKPKARWKQAQTVRKIDRWLELQMLAISLFFQVIANRYNSRSISLPRLVVGFVLSSCSVCPK